MATHPRLSIITPVYNAGPVLRETLESVASQTSRDFEYIVVDDGSTDDTPALLAEYAARCPWMTVATIANSGSAGKPRNLALDQYAAGEYVFFLDADDKLAPETVADLLTVADETGSDVVLCRMRNFGHGNRPLPRAVFEEERRASDFIDCYAYRTLGPTKMFRRSMLEKHDIRFEVGYRNGEDLPFVMRAFLEANHVSAIAGRDYYWVRNIADDHPTMKNTSRSGQPINDDMTKNLTVMRTVREHTEPGKRRDILLERFFYAVPGLQLCFNHRFLGLSPDQQKELVRRVQEVRSLWSERLRSNATDRIRTLVDALFTGDVDAIVKVVKRFSSNAWIVAAARDGINGTTLYVEGKGGELEVTQNAWSARVTTSLLSGQMYKASVRKRLRADGLAVKFVASTNGAE